MLRARAARRRPDVSRLLELLAVSEGKKKKKEITKSETRRRNFLEVIN